MRTELHSSLVLKLNGAWQGMGHMTVKDAFNRLFTSSATALEALDVIITPEGNISNHTRSYKGAEWAKLPVRDTDRWIGLPHGRRMRVPLVTIVPHHMTLPRVRIQFNKRGLYTRDRGICSYCLTLLTYDDATNDHVIPVSQGGETSWSNCTLACGPCNTFKANRTPEGAGMTLRRVPKAPGLMPVMPELRVNAPIEHVILLSPKRHLVEMT